MDLWGIPGEVVVQGGAVGVLILAVVGLMLGRIVPRRSVTDLLTLHAERLADEKARGDEWKATAKATEVRNDELARQLSELLEVGHTTNALIEGLKRASEQREDRR